MFNVKAVLFQKKLCQRGYVFNSLCNTNSEEFFWLGYLDSLISQTIVVNPLTNAINHTVDNMAL